MRLSMGPPDFKTWWSYRGRITVQVTDQSPCAPRNCTSNILTIDISI
jgi:hypothetical protein